MSTPTQTPPKPTPPKVRPPGRERGYRTLDSGGRGMPIGHAMTAILIAFALALLLDAHAMLSTARSLPLGSTQREIAVDVMTPIADVAGALRLTRPREAVESLLGRHGEGAAGDPFAGIKTIPRTGTAHTKAGAKGHEAIKLPALLAAPTHTHPLRMLVIGDSLAGSFGYPFYTVARATHLMVPAGPVDFQIDTGLTRADLYNWPAEIRRDMYHYHPNVLVVVMGLNDDQSIQAPNGQIYSFGTYPWQHEYERRLIATMSLGVRLGATVVYVGPPPVRQESRNWHYQTINHLIRAAALGRPHVVYVNGYQLFQNRHQGYRQYMRTKSGQLVQIRTDDGIHLQTAGSQLLAHRAIFQLGAVYRLPWSKGAQAQERATLASYSSR